MSYLNFQYILTVIHDTLGCGSKHTSSSILIKIKKVWKTSQYLMKL